MIDFSYKMVPITDKNWSKKEKEFINGKSEIITDMINEMVKERVQNGFPLAFCKEAVRRFEYSMKKKDNEETKRWLKAFTDEQESDRLNVKRFFDKKLYNTMSFIYNNEYNLKEKKKLYQELNSDTEFNEAVSANRENLKTLKDYSAILSEDDAWRCFIQYRDIQVDNHLASTDRKIDGNIANERALEDMYQFIDQTTIKMESLTKRKKETSYVFYMRQDMERVMNAVKNTRTVLTEQGFDDILITNTEEHMKSMLSEEKYTIHKNFYSSYDIDQSIELAMYKDMFKSINNCYFEKNSELQEFVSNKKNTEKLPAFQAQLLVNIKKITEPPKEETSKFSQFDNVDSFEEQTTYRMKLMREKDRIDKKQFSFYTFKNTEKMAASALKVQEHIGNWSQCTELTKATLPQMPAVHDYDGNKIMFVSKKSWDSYMENTGGDCYATIEDLQICDMNKIVVVDKDCTTQVYEPQVESIEGKNYWKGFKTDIELTKEMSVETHPKPTKENKENAKEVNRKNNIEENTFTPELPDITTEQLMELYGDGTITIDDYDFDDISM